MREYIDKTRLMQRINTGMTLIETMQEIIDAPAADVVEVVRCRECRFAPSGTDDSVEQGFGLEWPDDNWPYYTNPCPYYCDDEYYSQKPTPDFFCAAGKRKDGGQDDV